MEFLSVITVGLAIYAWTTYLDLQQVKKDFQMILNENSEASRVNMFLKAENARLKELEDTYYTGHVDAYVLVGLLKNKSINKYYEKHKDKLRAFGEKCVEDSKKYDKEWSVGMVASAIMLADEYSKESD